METKKAAKEVKKSPRQQPLPGMEDSKIEALEEKALQYAEVRDERIGLSQKEGELKGQLLDLMKAQKREHYQRGSICIDIVHEKENIKVKVKAGGGDADDEDEETSIVVDTKSPLDTKAGRESRVVAVPPTAKSGPKKSGPKKLADFHKKEQAKGRK